MLSVQTISDLVCSTLRNGSTGINEYMEQCDSEDGNVLASDTNDSISVHDDDSSVVTIDQVHAL